MYPNYVAATNHGLCRLREGFPLSLRLIREIHKVLLYHGRGSDKTARRVPHQPEPDWWHKARNRCICTADAIKEPILYLSLYFKTHRNQYYELLDRVRATGD